MNVISKKLYFEFCFSLIMLSLPISSLWYLLINKNEVVAKITQRIPSANLPLYSPAIVIIGILILVLLGSFFKNFTQGYRLFQDDFITICNSVLANLGFSMVFLSLTIWSLFAEIYCVRIRCFSLSKEPISFWVIVITFALFFSFFYFRLLRSLKDNN